MKSKKRRAMGAAIFVLCLAICMIFELMQIRESNERSFENQLNNPEVLFNGVFTMVSNWSDAESFLQGDEICVSISNESVNYDEKDLIFANHGKGRLENFSSYHVKYSDATKNGENSAFKTTWYLCRYDGGRSVILLDKNNEEAGRISFTTGEADWLNRRERNYHWIVDGETTPIYKRTNTTYNTGTPYLKSKYYSGVFDF